MPVLSHKKLTAVHGAAARMQAATAAVLKRLPGAQQGLLTDHAQTFDLFGMPGFILNDPMPGNQLGGHRARIGHRDGVRESEGLLERVALVCHVLRQHINLNGVGRHLRMLTATIRT